MIILRAFPVSLSIFWRLLLVLPVLIIAFAAVVFVAFSASFVLGLLLPPLLVVIGVISIILSFLTTPILIGTRLGLTAIGHTPKNSYGGLWVYAIAYGVAVAFITVIILGAVISGGGIVADVPLAAAAIFDTTASNVEILQYFFVNWPMFVIVVAAAFFALNCIYAALLLPLAAASVGKDANGNTHTPFAGFGAGFAPLLTLVLLVQVLGYFTYDLVSLAASPFMHSSEVDATMMDAMRLVEGVIPASFTWQLVVLIAFYILLTLWTTSLQCAGAVLVYDDRKGRHDAERAAARAVQHLTPADARALWQNRMPKSQ